MKQKETLASPYTKFFVPEMDISKPGALKMRKKIDNALRMLYYREARCKMERLLEEARPDIAHLHNIYHHISPSILAPIKKRNIPIVMTLHDYHLISPNYTLFHHGKIHEKDARGLHMRCIANKCVKDSRMYSAVGVVQMIVQQKILKLYKHVDVFVAPSNFMRDLCIKYGIEKHKIIHIPHPIDTTNVTPYYEDNGYVLYMGRLSEEKGVDVLAEAAKMTPDINYRIVGSGPLQSALERQTRGLKNIVFTGFKTGPALQRELKQARIVVVPSVWYENYPLSILEAKAAGKVVIASDIGGIPEMLDTRFLVPAGDARGLAGKLQTWFNEPFAKRRAVGIHNRTQVERMNNPDLHVNKILDLYKSLL